MNAHKNLSITFFINFSSVLFTSLAVCLERNYPHIWVFLFVFQLTIEMAEILWRRWLEVDEDAREPGGLVGYFDIATQHIRNQDNNVDDEGKKRKSNAPEPQSDCQETLTNSRTVRSLTIAKK